MRTRYPVVLFTLLVVGCLLSACSSGEPASDADGTNGSVQIETTTTIQRTTTTLAPASWEVVDPSDQTPEARFGSSLVYSKADDGLILFGGWDGGSVYLDDMWSYDPATATWESIEPTGTTPAPRASHATAYDPVGGQLVLFGGYNGSECYNDTWVYDITQRTWSSSSPVASKPSARYGHSMAYDPESKKIILFGGFDGTKEYNDTWAYDPASGIWTNLRPGGALPAARDSQELAYDPANKVFVMFGGWNTTTTFADTWTYDPVANEWTLREPVGDVPPGRALHQMVFDSSIQKIVVFGGGTSSATYNDLWLLDLTENTWVRAVVSGDPPPARAGHAMAYDEAARQILVFGGSNGIGDDFNDTWRLTR